MVKTRSKRLDGRCRLKCTSSSFKTVGERGTVPFFLADSEKLGQSPCGFETASSQLKKLAARQSGLARLVASAT
jgi:hypothetical protein